MEESCAIAERITALAVHHRDACNWISRVLPDTPSPAQWQPVARSLGYDIYGGTAGMALVFARLAHVSGNDAHRDISRKAMRTSLRAAAAFARAPRKSVLGGRERSGFYSGGLGVAWAAKEVAPIAEDPHLLGEADSLLRALSRVKGPPIIEDILFGNAGAIPALIDLEESGFEGALELAVRLGDDLLERAVPEEEGWSWKGLQETWYRNLTGFSHGAAGIGWALARLHQAVGDDKYREAATRAFQYERDHFMPEHGNWPDFRNPPNAEGKQRFAIYWCHGAPGIGLSRVLAYPILKDERLLEEARIARETTARFVQAMIETPGWNLQLCHGLFGNAETLWLIEEGLGIPDAQSRARAIATYAIERYGTEARRNGGPFTDWPTGMPGAMEVSFMKGLAGIAHYLLRCHDPGGIPTLLVPGIPLSQSRQTTSMIT